MEWRTGGRASLRAGLEPMTTGDNERLLRTHHRSLSKASIVYITTSPFGRRIWLISCNAPRHHSWRAGHPYPPRRLSTEEPSHTDPSSTVHIGAEPGEGTGQPMKISDRTRPGVVAHPVPESNRGPVTDCWLPSHVVR